MASIPSIRAKDIRQLLKAWDSTATLGQHPLTDLVCVKQKLFERGNVDTEIGRGMALKEILHGAIQTLRPHDGEIDVQDKAWYSYFIIRERYCFGRLPDWIMIQLNISERSFYRELREGTDAIGTYIIHLETESRLHENGAPLRHSSLSALVSFLPPNLPSHPTFQRQELEEKISSMLIEGDASTIALIGLPGVGKTTFAAALTTKPKLIETFTDGIIWINLGPTVDLQAVMGNLAAHIGIPDITIRAASQEKLSMLIRSQLSAERRLIILDDAWQVDHVRALLVGGSRCTTIVTSRLPALGFDVAGSNTFTIPELTQSESDAFLRQLAPSIFSDQSDALLTVLETAGGLPLALVIFGRYLHSKGYHGQSSRLHNAVEQISQREPRVQLSNTATPSGKNIASIIEISMSHLPELAQELLHKLTIFPPKPNSFELNVALATTNQSAEAFYNLVDSGLVESIGSDRYSLHQVIHDFAFNRDYQNQVEAAFLEQMAQISQDSKYNFNLLQLEQDNLTAALTLGFEGHKIDLVSQILFGLLGFLSDRGQIKQVETWVIQALALLEELPGNHILEQATLKYCRGRILARQGEALAALEELKQVIELSQAIGQTELSLHSQVAAMQLYLRRGEPNLAEGMANQVAQHIAESNDLIWQGEAHRSLCGFNYFQGNYQAAFDHISKAKALFEQTQHTVAMGTVYQNMGVLALELGRLDTAAILYEQALDHYQSAGNQIRVGEILNNMGVLAIRKGQWRKGIRLHQEALAHRQSIQDDNGQGQSLVNICVATLAQKDLDQAEIYLQQAMALAISQEAHFRQATLMVSQGVLAEYKKDYVGAVPLVEQAYKKAKELKREATLGEAAVKLGQLYLNLNDLAEAEKWLKIGRKKSKEQELPYQLAECHLYLAHYHAKEANQLEAKAYLNKAIPVIDQSTEGLDDPVRILILCAQLLEEIANDEEKAALYKQKAIATLNQLGEEIDDPQKRAFYIESYHL